MPLCEKTEGMVLRKSSTRCREFAPTHGGKCCQDVRECREGSSCRERREMPSSVRGCAADGVPFGASTVPVSVKSATIHFV